MRNRATIFGPVLLTLTAFGLSGAQEVGQEMILTGCLAQEQDNGEEVEFLLTGVMEEVEADEIELVPGEGINLTPHVGHTVGVTGTVIADDEEMDKMDQGEEMEEEMEEDDDLILRVTALRHLEASCGDG